MRDEFSSENMRTDLSSISLLHCESLFARRSPSAPPIEEAGRFRLVPWNDMTGLAHCSICGKPIKPFGDSKPCSISNHLFRIVRSLIVRPPDPLHTDLIFNGDEESEHTVIASEDVALHFKIL